MGRPRIRGYKPTVVDGIRFDSKREAARYAELRLLAKAGAIVGLKIQPRYPIIIGGIEVKYAGKNGRRQMVYVADFEYRDLQLGKTVIEDVKGHITEVYKIKRALMAAMGKEITET